MWSGADDFIASGGHNVPMEEPSLVWSNGPAPYQHSNLGSHMSVPSLFEEPDGHRDDDIYLTNPVSNVSPLSSKDIDRAFMPYTPQSPYISKKYGFTRPQYARSARFQGPYHH